MNITLENFTYCTVRTVYVVVARKLKLRNAFKRFDCVFDSFVRMIKFRVSEYMYVCVSKKIKLK